MLAVDPGRAKCGVAAVREDGVVLHKEIVASGEVEARVGALIEQFAPAAVVLGNRTGAREVRRRLEQLPSVGRLGGVEVVEEAHTSELARRRYFQAHPPRGLWRLVPIGMRTPPEPVDDWTAVILAERFLREKFQE
ncbi:hypothetical protein U7230_12485 [Carboxydochorda subterranea]|uniref:YqgF/RNase H-like domain-containing protein n=1 Tax=Carboxydichorda subterranea TaxID=3109565 RepID=A0ABZ1BVT8_9FIRM|nr:hypothetical protein [Limnochorda sp. L945t]WRP16892.1 hypothetical protein U7230_12485 [Limnochorda sp. L945t]